MGLQKGVDFQTDSTVVCFPPAVLLSATPPNPTVVSITPSNWTEQKPFNKVMFLFENNAAKSMPNELAEWNLHTMCKKSHTK